MTASEEGVPPTRPGRKDYVERWESDGGSGADFCVELQGRNTRRLLPNNSNVAGNPGGLYQILSIELLSDFL
jgi:hypothetical protein